MKYLAAMKKAFIVLVLWTGFITAANAEDLMSIYQQALQNDPTIAQAKATRDANAEVVPQAYAGLLPNVIAAANTTSVRTSANTPNSASGFTADNSINQHSYTLTLTQPLFNLQNWMSVRAAHATEKQADATYNFALQDLIMRVSTAYFNVLAAQDNLRFTSAEKTATNNQLKQIKERYQVGLATMTDVYQAQASYDALVAQEIAAQNQVANAMEALKQITDLPYGQLAPLGENVPLLAPQPADPVKWTCAAEQYNWNLLAARYAAQAAKETVRQNFAGHFPTLNAVGQYQKGNNLSFTAPATTESQSDVGLQLSMNLFQGGLVASQTRQAQDKYVGLSDAMEATHRQVIFDTQQSFNNVMAGISKIQADRIAVVSAQSALESMNAGYKAGTKTILDVLTAQQNLYQAQANLSTDQYAYINNTLALKEAAGTLNIQDVMAINHWLKND
jgi:outer membrane protein